MGNKIDLEYASFPSNWTVGEMKSLSKVMADAPFGSSIKNEDYQHTGIPIIQGKNILGRKCVWSDIRFVNEEKYNLLKKSHANLGDLIFPKVGTIGKVGILTSYQQLHKYLLSTNTMMFRANSNLAIQDFIYYFFTWSKVVEYIQLINPNSVQPVFNFTSLKKFKIAFPPLPEQERIAEVLSSLDDKIDLLQSQNKTLEEMAETLFRQWFVEEAEDEIGEISLSEISNHVKRSINPNKSPEQLFKHYSLPSFDNGRSPDIQFGRDILSNKYQISPGQILISKLNPRTPRVWFINSCDNYSICSTEFQVYEPVKKEYTEFIYCLLKSNETRDILSGASSGTSGSHQRVNPEDINKLSIKQPKTEILYKFHQITSAWLKKIDSNSLQIQYLETLRDTLLPKLMSGLVTVNELA